MVQPYLKNVPTGTGKVLGGAVRLTGASAAWSELLERFAVKNRCYCSGDPIGPVLVQNREVNVLQKPTVFDSPDG